MHEAEHLKEIKDHVWRPSKPTVFNVPCTNAGEQYSYTFPIGTVQVILTLRSPSALLQYCFTTGETDSNYITLEHNATLIIKDVALGGKTIYFESPSATQVLEILSFQT